MNACDITVKSPPKIAFKKTCNYYNNNNTIRGLFQLQNGCSDICQTLHGKSSCIILINEVKIISPLQLSYIQWGHPNPDLFNTDPTLIRTIGPETNQYNAFLTLKTRCHSSGWTLPCTKQCFCTVYCLTNPCSSQAWH